MKSVTFTLDGKDYVMEVSPRDNHWEGVVLGPNFYFQASTQGGLVKRAKEGLTLLNEQIALG